MTRGLPTAGDAPLAVLRSAVAAEVATSSLRQVARDVGMSAPGLRAFLNGSTPFPPTRRKIALWHSAKSKKTTPGGVSPAMVDNALALLVRHLPPEGRDAARRALLQAVARLSRHLDAPVPAWLTTLRRNDRDRTR